MIGMPPGRANVSRPLGPRARVMRQELRLATIERHGS